MAKAKAGARIKITLRCNECKQRNYNTMKNKKNSEDEQVLPVLQKAYGTHRNQVIPVYDKFEKGVFE